MSKGLFLKRPIWARGILLVLSLLLLPCAQAEARISGQTGDENEEVKRLIMVLRDEGLREHEPQQVIKAIERLGALKAATAIDDLAQLLTFRQPFEGESVRKTNIQMWQFPYYPAIKALSQIGKPALPALIKIIEENESGSFGRGLDPARLFDKSQSSSIASDNAISVILAIFREKPVKAVEYLKKTAANASTPLTRQRLTEAAEKTEEFVRILERR